MHAGTLPHIDPHYRPSHSNSIAPFRLDDVGLALAIPTATIRQPQAKYQLRWRLNNDDSRTAGTAAKPCSVRAGSRGVPANGYNNP
jgi:hypothetical protein